jgi:hypothetical protein
LLSHNQFYRKPYRNQSSSWPTKEDGCKRGLTFLTLGFEK